LLHTSSACQPRARCRPDAVVKLLHDVFQNVGAGRDLLACAGGFEHAHFDVRHFQWPHRGRRTSAGLSRWCATALTNDAGHRLGAIVSEELAGRCASGGEAEWKLDYADDISVPRLPVTNQRWPMVVWPVRGGDYHRSSASDAHRSRLPTTQPANTCVRPIS